jgi:hypothetical protein
VLIVFAAPIVALVSRGTDEPSRPKLPEARLRPPPR